ncbi:MAG: putative NUDIX/MutT-family hydrolase [Labilithrix sp.]|nr:putative NUDIX/MutT-family hydrolase [Labilithrix sp.]
MLDLKADREPVAPKDAATLVLVREGASGGIEIFCVERNKKSRFMGGAIVFPGGKLDPSDVLAEWTPLTTPPNIPVRGTVPFTSNDAHYRSLAIAAARETLEEAAILPVTGGTLGDEQLIALRKELATNPDALRAYLGKKGLRLDLAALHPMSRWVTPTAESRRFDARFFVAVAPENQAGAHDEHETMASFWASPAEILGRYDAGEVTLMPPTHRTIALLGDCATIRDVLAFVASSNLDPICPRLVTQREAAGETMALVLPGDPEHDVKTPRIAGPSRYVLRGERWIAEDAPRPA